MRRVLEEPDLTDWDARFVAMMAAWRARRDRKRAVAAEHKEARRIGLRRRHAAKLAQIHQACTIEPDGTVHCAVDPAYVELCPRQTPMDDLIDLPHLVKPPRAPRQRNRCAKPERPVQLGLFDLSEIIPPPPARPDKTAAAEVAPTPVTDEVDDPWHQTAPSEAGHTPDTGRSDDTADQAEPPQPAQTPDTQQPDGTTHHTTPPVVVQTSHSDQAVDIPARLRRSPSRDRPRWLRRSRHTPSASRDRPGRHRTSFAGPGPPSRAGRSGRGRAAASGPRVGSTDTTTQASLPDSWCDGSGRSPPPSRCSSGGERARRSLHEPASRRHSRLSNNH